MIDLVIRISEEDFEIMKHNTSVNNPLCPLSQEEIVTTIANGTPLPKGHGNLVDIDELFNIVFNPKNSILEIYKDRPRVQLENALESAFDHTQIIVEADKESEE